MRLRLIVGLVALLLLGGSLSGVALAARQPAGGDVVGTSVQRAPVAAEGDEEGEEDGETEDSEKGGRDDDAGNGPPPWAQGHDKARKDRPGKGKDWKDEWRRLTEPQRKARMDKLSKAHADGMRAFARCMEAAGDSRAERSSCEKPMPPGLAKKQ